MGFCPLWHSIVVAAATPIPAASGAGTASTN